MNEIRQRLQRVAEENIDHNIAVHDLFTLQISELVHLEL